MIGSPASTSFTDRRGKSRLPRGRGEGDQRGKKPHPLTWLNVVCLDAPLVAVSWQWLFARSFDVAIPPGGFAALFCTAWLIYLADRFGDSLAFQRQHASSLRQRFCLKHHRAWIVALVVVGGADLIIVSTRLDGRILVFAAPIAALAMAYLIVNQRRPGLWRLLPAKEITIGVLFAAGTIVALAPQFHSAATLPWLLFAALCSLNCISIAVWERWLDEAQSRVSIATAFPHVASYLPLPLMLVAIASAVLVGSDSSYRALYLCIAASAAVLMFVHLARRRLQADVRTALADLVLLTPAVVWVATLFG